MLFDKFLSIPGFFEQRIPGLVIEENAHALLHLAQKFVIEDHVAEMAVAQMSTAGFAAAVRELGVLPYDHVWIEFRNKLSTGFLIQNTTEIAANQLQRTREIAERYGHLGKIDRWFTCIAFSAHNTPPNAFMFSPQAFDLEHADDGEPMIRIPVISRIGCDKDEPTRQAMLLSATLAIINSPKIIEREHVDFTRLNKKRTQNGKLPLFSHHILRLSRQMARDLKENEDMQAEAEKRRLHWVRGHFKHRKNGMFWWRPHMAGSREKGIVEKDYIA